MTVTILHNPHCGTLRNTLALVLGAGIEPRHVQKLLARPGRHAELFELQAADDR